MKNILKSLSVLGLAAVAFAPFIRADEPPATPPPAAPAGDHPRPARGDRFKLLADKLQLTDDQKTKIKPILEKSMQDGRALREDDSLSREDKHAKGAVIRQATHDQIRALLTADQQKTFDAMPQRGGRRGPSKADGDAPATPQP